MRLHEAERKGQNKSRSVQIQISTGLKPSAPVVALGQVQPQSVNSDGGKHISGGPSAHMLTGTHV